MKDKVGNAPLSIPCGRAGQTWCAEEGEDEMDIDGDKNELKALLEDVARTVREDQEAYLVRVIMKVMTQRYGKGDVVPGATGIPALKELARNDLNKALMILDAIYSAIAKSLLDNPAFDMLDIRTEVRTEILLEKQRVKIAKEAVERGALEWCNERTVFPCQH